MLGYYVSPVRTPITSDQLCDALARELGEAPNSHMVIALCAMSAFENGWWKSCWNYNLGNVKAGPTWEGEYTCLTNVREIIKGDERWYSPEGETAGKGGPVIGQRYSVPPGHPQTRFRAYPTLDAGIQAWSSELATTYRPSLDVLKRGGSTDDFITSLKSESYFTGDPDVYRSQVGQIYRQLGGPGVPTRPLVRPLWLLRLLRLLRLGTL